MKSLIYIPFALSLGLIVGSWSPRSEVASLKKELASVRELLENPPRQNRSINEVTSLLGIERAESPAEGKSIRTAAGALTSEKSNEFVAEEPADEDVAESDEVTSERTLEDRNAAIDKAVELWEMRVDIARSTFISNTGMQDQQAMQFDQIIDNMNLRIGETIDLFAENMEGAEEVQVEAGLRIMNEITESIVEAYDGIDGTMSEGWRRNTGENFSLLDFIDPEVGRPLVGLEDQLGQMRGGQNQED